MWMVDNLNVNMCCICKMYSQLSVLQHLPYLFEVMKIQKDLFVANTYNNFEFLFVRDFDRYYSDKTCDVYRQYKQNNTINNTIS